jgi:hypothetical protein
MKHSHGSRTTPSRLGATLAACTSSATPPERTYACWPFCSVLSASGRLRQPPYTPTSMGHCKLNWLMTRVAAQAACHAPCQLDKTAITLQPHLELLPRLPTLAHPSENVLAQPRKIGRLYGPLVQAPCREVRYFVYRPDSTVVASTVVYHGESTVVASTVVYRGESTVVASTVVYRGASTVVLKSIP